MPTIAGVWYRVARRVVRSALGLLFRVRLVGEPPSGPYLLIANHQGWSDPFLVLAMLPTRPRIYFIGDRRATMTVWWKRAILASLGVVVPVSRDSSLERAAMLTALRLLREGSVVAIFPEGRVSRTEADVCPECLRLGRTLERGGRAGEHHRALAPFERGVGYLALKAQVPVVPVWVSGTGELYLGRELSVVVGEPVPAAAETPTKEATRAVADRLRAALLSTAVPWTGATDGPRRWRWLTHVL